MCDLNNISYVNKSFQSALVWLVLNDSATPLNIAKELLVFLKFVRMKNKVHIQD